MFWAFFLWNPALASADGANEYSGDLLKSGEGSWSLQSQADFGKEGTRFLLSPDILLGMDGGFEALLLQATHWDAEADSYTFDSLLALARYQLANRLALGVGVAKVGISVGQHSRWSRCSRGRRYGNGGAE